jgi:hypothetical protein
MHSSTAQTHPDDLSVTYIGRFEAIEFVRTRVKDVDVVLDLGPGICPQPFVEKPYVHICVDAHRPYLERLQREVGHDPKYVFINAPWDEVLGKLPDKSVDSVFALDFIEHLEKQDGFRMLREAQRVARCQVVVYTPLGFFPQSYDDANKPDRWGMHGGYWQTHRSGWDYDDFGPEWEFVCSPDFLFLDEHNQPLSEPLPAFWAIRNLSGGSARRYSVVDGQSIWPHFKKTLEVSIPPAVFKRLQRAWWKLAGGQN